MISGRPCFYFAYSIVESTSRNHFRIVPGQQTKPEPLPKSERLLRDGSTTPHLNATLIDRLFALSVSVGVWGMGMCMASAHLILAPVSARRPLAALVKG